MTRKNFYAILVLLMTGAFALGAEPASVDGDQDNGTSFEIKFSLGWTFGAYKETTFANISQSLLSPHYQLEAKIKSGNFIHTIAAEYFSARPSSAMTKNAVAYKTYDPVTGETYYDASSSSLSFHKINLKYDLNYGIMKNGNLDFSVGGSFMCNAFLQFEHYPSITGIICIGPSCAMDWNIDERNSISVSGGFPLFGYGVRPSYAGCDARLMKYAEENFFKILTLGNFLSLHNYQAVFLDFEYKVKATDWFTTGLGFDFEYSRVAVPKERPLYYVDGNIKTFVSFNF